MRTSFSHRTHSGHLCGLNERITDATSWPVRARSFGSPPNHGKAEVGIAERILNLFHVPAVWSAGYCRVGVQRGWPGAYAVGRRTVYAEPAHSLEADGPARIEFVAVANAVIGYGHGGGECCVRSADRHAWVRNWHGGATPCSPSRRRNAHAGMARGRDADQKMALLQLQLLQELQRTILRTVQCSTVQQDATAHQIASDW
ncbi:hypothetical protein J1614_009726 [Plenodomus biglobosus]|nr:hypothetical protein J1614_009726 [Plenodomus biglobosus]